jgi:hypothetical protein
VKDLEHRRILPAFSYSVNLMLAENKAARFVINERRQAQRAVQDDHGCVAAEKYVESLVAVRAFDRKRFYHGSSSVLRLLVVALLPSVFIVPPQRE